MIPAHRLHTIGDPTPEAVRREIERLGLTQQAVADLLRVDLRTVQRYLQRPGSVGSVPCPFAAYAILCMMATSFSMRPQKPG